MNASPLLVSIGYGAMARSLQSSLAKANDGLELQACLLPPSSSAQGAGGMQRFSEVAELIAARPALVIECATHEAVRTVVPTVLAAGIDVIIVSIGAMADPRTLTDIERAAREGGASAITVAGAVGGLDALRAAACAGLDEIVYTGRKPPQAWKGTPADDLLDLDALRSPATFYDGSATDAARDYPKNTNVTAAVALAGIGFEATRVRLVADPGVRRNVHEIEATGAFGSLRVVLENLPLPGNPKTSWLAALSVEQAVRRHFACLKV